MSLNSKVDAKSMWILCVKRVRSTNFLGYPQNEYSCHLTYTQLLKDDKGLFIWGEEDLGYCPLSQSYLFFPQQLHKQNVISTVTHVHNSK